MTRVQRIFYRSMADLTFVVHVLAGAVLVFFWEFKTTYIIYVVVLTASLLDNALLDFCFLAKWECYFRKKLDPNLDFKTFFGYYLKTFFGFKFTPKQVHRAVLTSLWCMFIINIVYWISLYVRK